jgi:hypothetical protein
MLDAGYCSYLQRSIVAGPITFQLSQQPRRGGVTEEFVHFVGVDSSLLDVSTYALPQ